MPNADVLGPLQVALHTVLTGDATLMARLAGDGIFEYVPEGQGFPYVVVGEAVETPDGAHDRFGADTVQTLHIWSAYHGWKEAQEIKGDLMRLLDHQELTITGHHTVAVRFMQAVSMRDSDQDLRHVAIRFAVVTEHDAA